MALVGRQGPTLYVYCVLLTYSSLLHSYCHFMGLLYAIDDAPRLGFSIQTGDILIPRISGILTFGVGVRRISFSGEQLCNKRMLTHMSLSSFLWDMGKQYRPRSGAAKRGV